MAQYTPQDLIDNLNYLNETKQLIKSSIINKGQEIDDNDTFRSYADKINLISCDNRKEHLSFFAKMLLFPFPAVYVRTVCTAADSSRVPPVPLRIHLPVLH